MRKLDARRSTSNLPELIDFVLSRPLVSVDMIAKAIGVTPGAAQNLVVEFGLREATGRGAIGRGEFCEGDARYGLVPISSGVVESLIGFIEFMKPIDLSDHLLTSAKPRFQRYTHLNAQNEIDILRSLS